MPSLMDPTALILTRAFEHLAAADLDCPIFGEPPADTEMPYAALDVAVEGRRGSLEVHVWSAYRGEAEALAILGRAHTLLHDRRLVSQDGVAVWVIHESTRVMVEDAGAVRHGLSVFTLLISQRR